MATKKDLVEAHAFSRRRLVTAFVSGAPGGREVEPARPGRVIIGGLALSVLLIAGAAIAGIFSSKAPADWAKPGLFISKTSAASYVIIKESDPAVLRPVINITSAKLILGAGMKPTFIQQEAIDKEVIGEDIGILGAPTTPPRTDQLVVSGWTACTGAQGDGIRLNISREPQVRAEPGAGAVVQVGKEFYLLARASETSAEQPGTFSYKLPADGGVRDNILAALGLQSSSYATKVGSRFLALVPNGGDLAMQSFGLEGAGRPAPGAEAAGLPKGARIGDVEVLPDGDAIIVTAQGPADLSPFALAVYQNLPGARVDTMRSQLTSNRVRAPYAAANWPDGGLTSLVGEQCLQLEAAADRRPEVRLAAAPGPDASSTDVPAGTKDVVVDTGLGAYVLSGDWSDRDRGTPFLMDPTGKAFELVGDSTPTLLGYGSYAAPVVPDTWVDLFAPGVPLSQDAALCPPTHKRGAPCK